MLPGAVTRPVSKMFRQFHQTVIENRKGFLAQEMEALRRSIAVIDEEMRGKGDALAQS